VTSDQGSESYLQDWTRGHERDVGLDCRAHLDSTDLKPWLYNGWARPTNPAIWGTG